MTNQHPITPPPEVVDKWVNQSPYIDSEGYIATQAARWGADQELEACCEWLFHECSHLAIYLRAARRPKPPSLKEQALTAMLHLQKAAETTMDTIEAVHIICRALEALPND